jgi:transcriptional regulator with XRE-family HTH domain
MADLAGIHRTAVSLMERGRREPRLETLLRSIGTLEVEPAELVDDLGVWIPSAAAVAKVEAKRARKRGDKSKVSEGRSANSASAPGTPQVPASPIGLAFGRRLHDIRTQAVLSQIDFEQLSGLHRTEISMMERGLRGPGLATLHKIAGALRVIPSELLVGLPEWKPGPPGSVDSGAWAVLEPVKWPVTFLEATQPAGPGRSETEPDPLASDGIDNSDPRDDREGRAAIRGKLVGRFEIPEPTKGRRVRKSPPEDHSGDAGTSGPPEDSRASDSVDDASRLLSETVHSLRLARGLTQRQLSERARIDRTAIAALELSSRMPSGREIAGLAKGLGVGLTELVEGIPARKLPIEVRAEVDPTYVPKIAGLRIDPDPNESDILTRVARNTAALRHRRGWSQDRLARVSGIHRSGIAKIEVAKTAPSLATLDKLAKALKVSPGALTDQLLIPKKRGPR